jgi:hypothetical protein
VEVRDLMAEVHLIPSELASYHVQEMDDEEVERRFRMYTGMELSVAGATLRAGNVFATPFSRPATMMARRRHSTLFPGENSATVMPDSEVENGVQNRTPAEAGVRGSQLSG